MRLTARQSLLVLFSLVGIADALYLSITRLTHNELACSIVEGCNTVATSPYATLFGFVPLAYLGLFFYVLIFMLVMLAWRRGLQVVALVGLLSSLYFIYLQAFVINAFCVYCIVSAVLSVGICILAFLPNSDHTNESDIIAE